MTSTKAPHNRKLSAAIESVFRLTHGREMTPEERRLFGVADNNTENRYDRDFDREPKLQKSGRNRVPQ